MIRVVLPIVAVVYAIVIALNCMGQLVVKPVDPSPVLAQRELSTSKTVEVQGATLTARKTTVKETFQVGGKLQKANATTNTVEDVRSYPLMFERRNKHILRQAKDNGKVEKGIGK